MTDPQVFIDPTDGLEYLRIPASDLPNGDELDSELENVEDIVVDPERPAAGTVRSQNGWTCGRAYVASFTIPGTTTRMALRKGDVSVVLLDFFAWYDKHIESIDGGQLDDWGFAERPIRGYDEVYSNHFSGTAGDLNALKHPMGKHTLSEPVKAKIRAKLQEYGGVIRPGFDYHNRPDDMHYEIDRTPYAVRVQASRIRSAHQQDAPFGRTPNGDRILGLHVPLMSGADVYGVIRAFREIGNRQLEQGKVYTRAVADITNLFKERHRIVEAGFGAQCWDEIRSILRHMHPAQ